MPRDWRVRQWSTRNTWGWTPAAPPFALTVPEGMDIEAVACLDGHTRQYRSAGWVPEPGRFALTLQTTDSRGEAHAQVHGSWTEECLVAIEHVPWTLPGELTCRESFRWEGSQE